MQEGNRQNDGVLCVFCESASDGVFMLVRVKVFYYWSSLPIFCLSITMQAFARSMDEYFSDADEQRTLHTRGGEGVPYEHLESVKRSESKYDIAIFISISEERFATIWVFHKVV